MIVAQSPRRRGGGAGFRRQRGARNLEEGENGLACSCKRLIFNKTDEGMFGKLWRKRP
jgi:hypothetical protein